MSHIDPVDSFVSACLSLKSKCPLCCIVLCVRLLHGNPAKQRAHGSLIVFRTKFSFFVSGLTDCMYEQFLLELHGLTDIPWLVECFAKRSQSARRIIEEGTMLKRFTVLSGNIPFSLSRRWAVQQSFYECKKLDAWKDSLVPSQISSNSFIAQYYLGCIDDFVRRYNVLKSRACRECCRANDCKCSQCSDRIPRVCIVEVGAGHGKLSLIIARLMMARVINGRRNACSPSKHCYENLAFSPTNQWTGMVVSTDFHNSNFNDLVELPWVKLLCEAEVLDFAQLSTFVDSAALSGTHDCHCLFSDEPLASKHQRNPFDIVVVIGNYALDSFPSDLFYKLSHGQGCEIQVSALKKEKLKGIPVVSIQGEVPDKSSQQLMHYILNADECPIGGYSIPVGAFTLFEKIFQVFDVCQSAAPSLPYFGLITGDCMLCAQDAAWQTEEVRSCCAAGGAEVSMPGDFSVPHCSPQHDVYAVPLSSHTVKRMFDMVFGRGTDVHNTLSNTSHESAHQLSVQSPSSDTTAEFLPRASVPPRTSYVQCTPLSGSMFQVQVQFQAPNCLASRKVEPSVGFDCTTFGPSEFSTVTEFCNILIDGNKELKKIRHDHVSPALPCDQHVVGLDNDFPQLEQLKKRKRCVTEEDDNGDQHAVISNLPCVPEKDTYHNPEGRISSASAPSDHPSLFLFQSLLEVKNNYDFHVFIEFQWNILESLKSEMDRARDNKKGNMSLIERWCGIAMRCWRGQYCCSWTEFCHYRCLAVQWFLALQQPVSYVCALQVFMTDPAATTASTYLSAVDGEACAAQRFAHCENEKLNVKNDRSTNLNGCDTGFEFPIKLRLVDVTSPSVCVPCLINNSDSSYIDDQPCVFCLFSRSDVYHCAVVLCKLGMERAAYVLLRKLSLTTAVARGKVTKKSSEGLYHMHRLSANTSVVTSRRGAEHISGISGQISQACIAANINTSSSPLSARWKYSKHVARLLKSIVFD